MVSAVEKHYNEKALTYDENSALFYFKVYDVITWRYTEPYIPTKPDAVVLDAGGGTGKWSIPIAKKGPRVVLVDISEDMLNVARRKIAEQRLQDRITTKKGDIRKLDYPDESFDMVFCDHTLCFIQDQDTLVRELIRILKRNRPIIISGQNRYVLSLSILKDNIDLATKILSGQEHFPMNPNRSVKVYALSPDEFINLLTENGIRINRIIGKGITMPLAITAKKYWTKKYDQKFLEKVLEIEMNLCERKDALSLAGHLQAIGYRSK